MKKYVHTFDTVATKFIGRLPVSLQSYFAWLGRFTTPLMWASAIAAFHMLWLTPGKIYGPALFVLLLLPVASIMKFFFRRHRPATIYAAAMRVKSYSFPSSHSYAAALAGGYVAAVAWHAGSVWLTTLAVAFIAIIGLSRVHVGAHYPSDVLAGLGLGVTVLAVLLSLT